MFQIQLMIHVEYSAIFRITGACYFWQFSIFDGDEFGTVYTQPNNFELTSRLQHFRTINLRYLNMPMV